MTNYLNIPPLCSREQSFDRLKIAAGTTAYDYALKVYPQLEDLARSMEFTHCYTILPTDLVPGVSELSHCEQLAICISSCSEKITAATNALMEQGSYLEAYILDDIINEMLFNGSNTLIDHLEHTFGEQGRGLTSRYSPGEAPLDMAYQVPLLAVFCEEAPLSHITLNESNMLRPEKTMLYLFGADMRLPIQHHEKGCARCPNIGCFFRKAAASPEK